MQELVLRRGTPSLQPNPDNSPHVQRLWERLVGLLYRRAWLDAHHEPLENVNGELYQIRLKLMRHGELPMELEWRIAEMDDEARAGVAQVLGQ